MHDPQKWRIGSLFSGIGGLELGLERAGIGETVVQVEQDPYALQILERHWPKAKRYRDVRTVGAAELGGLEVLCGGFPCQDISTANQNAQGINGERSGLWFEFARIIREVGPRIVIVENVAALLRRGLDRVLGDLASMGYDAEWGCISAASVGAHHLRERIFIVAYPNGFGHLDRGPGIFSTETRQQTLLDLARGLGRGTGESAIRGREQNAPGGSQVVADSNGVRHSCGNGEHERPASRRNESRGRGPGGQERRQVGRSIGEDRSIPGRWLPEPDVGRVANGIPNRVDRLRCLGNAVVPQAAEYLGLLIKKHHRRHNA